MNNFKYIIIYLLLVGFVCGCGGGQRAPVADSVAFGPHGGPVVVLPDDQGYGEILVEWPQGDSRRSGQRLVVYFLKPDLKTSCDSLPSDVTVALRFPGRTEPIQVALRAEPRTDSPDGKGRFASVPGPYGLDQLFGELKAKVGGREVSLPFSSPR